MEKCLFHRTPDLFKGGSVRSYKALFLWVWSPFRCGRKNLSAGDFGGISAVRFKIFFYLLKMLDLS